MYAVLQLTFTVPSASDKLDMK